MTSLHLGSLVVDDPVTQLLWHVRDSRFADYFAAQWVSSDPPVTPAHLWRANHLGAGWQIQEVRDFMDASASGVSRHLTLLPGRHPGDPGRADWFAELIDLGTQTRGVGATRLTKAVHPLAPSHVPFIDRQVVPWAFEAWTALKWSGLSWEDAFTHLDLVWSSVQDELDRIVAEARRHGPDLLISPFGALDAFAYHAWTHRAGKSESAV